jgi:hypothetical protein
MPILNKFRLRTPFEEFENYLGEEMNAFSGFFIEETKEAKELNETIETPAFEELKSEKVPDSYWLKIKSFFKKGL